MSSILFITRTWHGNGGLQRLSRDLWQGISGEYGDRATVCRPMRPGIGSFMMFGFRGLCTGISAGLKGSHIHLGDASIAPLGAIIAILTHAHVTVTVAGLDVIYPAAWYQFLLRRSLPYMHRICCISESTAQTVRERGVGEEKIVIIPCGVWTEDVQSLHDRPVHNDPVLLSICRLVPRKGIAWFVSDVLPLVLTRYPTLTYLVIGEGPECTMIEMIITERHLHDTVRLLGPLDDATRDRVLEHADMLIAPNIAVADTMEGFGIVCIEASVRGVPVVASRLEGLQDAVIDGKTGSFFESGNATDAARVVQSMLARRMDPADVSRAAVGQYDWSELITRYRDEVFR